MLFSQDLGLSAREIYEKSQNSIVFINTYDVNGSLLSYGSGVVISEDGLVYTNFHVVDGYTRIVIRNQNIVYTQIAVCGFLPLYDAAILKIKTEKSFPDYIKTNQTLPVIGEVIYAIGNPQGYTKTLSEGLISGLREIDGVKQLQYTASISPGSSGGALFNGKGELIGITSSSIKSGQNLNFAIPIHYFNSIPTVDYKDSSQLNNMQQLFASFNNMGTLEDYRSFESIHRFVSKTEPSVNCYLLASEFFKKFSTSNSSAAYLTKAIELDTGNKLLYKLRGDAYSMLFENDSSISDYNKAIIIDPYYIEAYIGRALVYENSLNDFRKAADDYTKVIDINPEYNYLFTYRSNCFLSLGDTSRAIQDLDKSFSFDQKYDYNYYKRARLYKDLEMYEEAIDDYTEAIKLNPNEPDYFLERAILYSKTRQNWPAIDDYKTYSKFYPESELPYNNSAYSFMSENDFETAEKYFNKSLSFDPKHIDSYIGLAILSYRQRKIMETLRNMYMAIQIEPLLENGINGIIELETKGWFWNENEKSDMKEIFKLMRIEPGNNKKQLRTVKAKSAEQ
jgi:tetratricopeptide (TPR) repeat protein